jgi:hypothetical protein
VVFRRRGGNVGGADLFQHPQDLAGVVGQIVHPLEEALLQRRSKGLVKLADASGLGIQFGISSNSRRRRS